MNNSSHLNQLILFLKSIIIIVFIASNFPRLRCEDDTKFDTCRHTPYECGHIKDVSFPFWGAQRPEFCGHPGFMLNCSKENESSVQLITDHQFRVENISQMNGANSVKFKWLDLENGPCSTNIPSFETRSSSVLPFVTYPPTVENLTLYYDCKAGLESVVLPPIMCDNKYVYYATDSVFPHKTVLMSNCPHNVSVPVFRSALEDHGQIESADDWLKFLTNVLEEGFEVDFSLLPLCQACQRSDGECGYNKTIVPPGFRCFCRDGEHEYQCPTHHGRNWKVKTFIVILSGGFLVLLFCIMVCCFTKIKPSKFSSKITKKDQDIENFIRNNGQLAVKRYRFSDVKKMTKYFKDKLGQGGYGEVYKGKLLDGRLVAVKLLKSSKGNGEEFVNEVASISRTSHVNIVTLLGFCLEGTKRALIYEFMPNGSLEKFVYKDNIITEGNHSLEWDKLLQISVGIARGLEYLHRGCNTKILHLDIKPHNILLDENFHPKISDFGLSKHCQDKVSTVMLLDVRGTIGYIAPEVFDRNFGEVSSKSDTYSYGKMILEMVGGRKNVEVDVSHTSKIYFPDWVYKHLEFGNNLQLWGEMSSEDNRVARKMIIVGLWCIQANPLDRPSMSKVIAMLEGDVEALRIPPKPTFSLPKSPERISARPVPKSFTSSSL